MEPIESPHYFGPRRPHDNTAKSIYQDLLPDEKPHVDKLHKSRIYDGKRPPGFARYDNDNKKQFKSWIKAATENKPYDNRPVTQHQRPGGSRWAQSSYFTEQTESGLDTGIGGTNVNLYVNKWTMGDGPINWTGNLISAAANTRQTYREGFMDVNGVPNGRAKRFDQYLRRHGYTPNVNISEIGAHDQLGKHANAAAMTLPKFGTSGLLNSTGIQYVVNSHLARNGHTGKKAYDNYKQRVSFHEKIHYGLQIRNERKAEQLVLGFYREELKRFAGTEEGAELRDIVRDIEYSLRRTTSDGRWASDEGIDALVANDPRAKSPRRFRRVARKKKASRLYARKPKTSRRRRSK